MEEYKIVEITIITTEGTRKEFAIIERMYIISIHWHNTVKRKSNFFA